MIETLYKILAKVGITKGQDIALHMIAGFTISFIVGIVINPAMGWFIGTSAGFAKETYDTVYKGWYIDKLPIVIAFKERWNYWDFFFTMVAAVVATMILGMFGL